MRSDRIERRYDHRPGTRTGSSGRTLVLVDIENLAGNGRLTPAATRDSAALVQAAIPAVDTQVIVACNKLNIVNVMFDWPDARILVGLGPHAADLALIDAINHENVEARFARVIIGSGDGIYAEPAARLAATGIDVTVLIGYGGLSHRLRLAAHTVERLERDVVAVSA